MNKKDIEELQEAFKITQEILLEQQKQINELFEVIKVMANKIVYLNNEINKGVI